MPHVETSEAWERALVDAAHGMARMGRSDTTIERVLTHVRTYANATPKLGPWEATPASVERWCDRFAGGAAERSRRSSLRTFYRWAVSAGRMTSDPTMPTVRTLRALEPPQPWHEPIQTWLGWLRASGAARESQRVRRYYMTRFAREVGIVDPWAVTNADLIEWLSGHKWRRETIRAARSAVRSFYTWAVDSELVEKSPAAKLPPIKSRPNSRRPATEDAYQVALARAEDRERLMLRMAAELGMRRAEISRAHSFHLTSDNGWWLEVHGKGDRLRSLPVPEDLAREMLQLGAGFFFPGNVDGHLSADYVGVLLSRLLPDGYSAHTLRHKFATDAYGATKNLLAIQHLLGHGDPKTTEHYVQVSDDALRATVAAARDGSRTLAGSW